MSFLEYKDAVSLGNAAYVKDNMAQFLGHSYKDGWTGLMSAAYAGHVSIVQLLLAESGKVNADGDSALTLAIRGPLFRKIDNIYAEIAELLSSEVDLCNRETEKYPCHVCLSCPANDVRERIMRFILQEDLRSRSRLESKYTDDTLGLLDVRYPKLYKEFAASIRELRPNDTKPFDGQHMSDFIASVKRELADLQERVSYLEVENKRLTDRVSQQEADLLELARGG